MKERLTLLASIDPYVGSYYSRGWVQRQVLRMNDDDIELMDKEIDEEKSMGLGLPTEITTQVAQQQMMGQVDAENQVAQAQAMNDAGLDKAEAKQTASSKDTGDSSKPKDKQQKKPSSQPKGDLKLEDGDFSFSRLKRLL